MDLDDIVGIDLLGFLFAPYSRRKGNSGEQRHMRCTVKLQKDDIINDAADFDLLKTILFPALGTANIGSDGLNNFIQLLMVH